MAGDSNLPLIERIFQIPAKEMILNHLGETDFEYFKLLFDVVGLPESALETFTFGEYLVCINEVCMYSLSQENIQTSDNKREIRMAPVLYNELTHLLNRKNSVNKKLFLSLGYRVLIHNAFEGLKIKRDWLHPKMIQVIHKNLVYLEANHTNETLGYILERFNKAVNENWNPLDDIEEFKRKIENVYINLYWNVFILLFVNNTCEMTVEGIKDKYGAGVS